MTESTPAQSAEPAETVSTPSPSLEEISREFTVEEQAQNFTAQPQPQPTQAFQQVQAPQYTPDPVTDPEGYKQFVNYQRQVTTQLDGTLREVLNKVTSFEQRIAQQKLDADVDRAVQVVNKKLNVDKDLAEIALEKEYRSNPTFKKIWDNRDRNPEAFERALSVIADKWAPKFQVRQDPQLAENVRAAKSSQQTMATTKQQNPNDEWANLTPEEFERKWSRMVHGG